MWRQLGFFGAVNVGDIWVLWFVVEIGGLGWGHLRQL